MASTDRFERILSQGKSNNELSTLLWRVRELAFEVNSYIDPKIPALKVIAIISKDLAKIYKRHLKLGGKAKPKDHAKYRDDIAIVISKGGIALTDAAINHFSPNWQQLDEYRNPLMAARSKVAEYFKIPTDDRTIRKDLRDRLVHLPKDEEIAATDLLFPLLRTLNYSDEQIRSAIEMLRLNV